MSFEVKVTGLDGQALIQARLRPRFIRQAAAQRPGGAGAEDPRRQRPSCGTAGQERWRIWAWLQLTPCQEPRKARMPMPPASGALAAYKDFLALWKDADSDIPILKEAKAEYAKLQ